MSEISDLKTKLNDHLSIHNDRYLVGVTAGAELLLIWIGYLRTKSPTKKADRLLDAVQGAIIEVACCLSLGLVRPAIFSLRVQLELLLAWIYFADHPIEWSRVESGENDFPMRSFFLKYFSEFGVRFVEKRKLLESKATRKEKDPYGILSVHVHSTSAYAAPKVAPLAAAVQPKDRCDECVQLQAAVAEYLTDTLAAWFARHWADLPQKVQGHLKGRLSPPELKEFCG